VSHYPQLAALAAAAELEPLQQALEVRAGLAERQLGVIEMRKARLGRMGTQRWEQAPLGMAALAYMVVLGGALAQALLALVMGSLLLGSMQAAAAQLLLP
jgi:hypothetical protein